MAMTAPRHVDPDIELGLGLLRSQIRIRRFEETVAARNKSGQLPGAVHLCIGQEAIAAGVGAALRDDDYLTSHHRGHGHILAKGGDPNRCMAELFGRATGYNRGKGGSMHLAHMGLGIIGANGIVGAGTALASGAALSAKLRGTDQVSICLFGDGAANEGTFHESLNLAAVWSLPVVFVCENNGFGELTRTAKVTALGAIVQRADAYGIPGVEVDGNDALAVHAAVRDAVDRARRGEGPTLIEATTFRMREHAEGLEMVFGRAATAEEIEEWNARDPILRLRRQLEAAGVDPADLAAMEEAAAAEMEQAVEYAERSPLPSPESAFEDMWS